MKKQDKSYQVNKDIRLNEDNYKRLVDTLIRKVNTWMNEKTPLLARYSSIDKDIAGYIQPDTTSKDAQKIEEAYRRGESIILPDIKLPCTASKLDNIISYVMSTIAPNGTIYGAVAPKDKIATAKAFSALLNEQGKYFKHFGSISRVLNDALKYNVGAAFILWEDVYGNRLGNNEVGEAEVLDNQLLMQGNCISPADMYNFFYDIKVPIDKLAVEGEFVGQVAVESPFNILKKRMNEEYFFNDYSTGSNNWYTEPPIIRPQDNLNDKKLNNTAELTVEMWSKILGRPTEKGSGLISQSEVTTMYMRVVPAWYGLSKSINIEIWKFVLFNGNCLVHASKLPYVHDKLPVALFIPNLDTFGLNQKAVSEALNVLQNMQSHLFNMYKHAKRKEVMGIVAYNPHKVDLESLVLPLSGLVPVNLTSEDGAIHEHIHTFNSPAANENFMQDIANVNELSESLIPTKPLNSGASFQRATTYEVAATVQEAAKTLWMIAKKFDEQFMFDSRLIQLYNVLQFQKSMTLVATNGETIEVNPSEFRDTKLEFIVSDILRGIDQLLIQNTLKEAISYLVQIPDSSAKYDIIGIVDYLTTLSGDNTDLTQFKLKTPLEGLSVEEQQMAFDLLQQAKQQQEGTPNV